MPDIYPDPNNALLEVTRLVGQLTTQVNTPHLPEPVPFSLNTGRSFGDFLTEFEAYALRTFGDDKKLWTPRLAKYLKPPALTLYQEFMVENPDYDRIKTALSNSYDITTPMTSADHMEKFQSVTYNRTDGIRGLVSRLKFIAVKMYNGASDDSVDDLVMRRCISCLPSHLRTTLKFWRMSNSNATLQDLIKLGSELEESESVPEAAALSTPTPEIVAVTSNKVNSVSSKQHTLPDTANENSASAPVPKSRSEYCNYCHKRGHVIADCYRRKNVCFECGQPGHYAAQCPNRIPSTLPPGRSNSINYSQGATSHLPSSQPTSSGPYCVFCCVAGHSLAMCPRFDSYMDAKIDRRLNR